jgi:hypothetical protein
MKPTLPVVIGSSILVTVPAVQADDQPRVVATTTLTFEGRSPSVSGSRSVNLEAGDEVHVHVDAPSDVVGRRLTATIACEVRHESGHCPKTITHEPHQHRIDLPTHAEPLRDFQPRLVFSDGAGAQRELLVTQHDSVFVAPQRMVLVLDSDLHVEGPNLVLGPGAAPTAEERGLVNRELANGQQAFGSAVVHCQRGEVVGSAAGRPGPGPPAGPAPPLRTHPHEQAPGRAADAGAGARRPPDPAARHGRRGDRPGPRPHEC